MARSKHPMIVLGSVALQRSDSDALFSLSTRLGNFILYIGIVILLYINIWKKKKLKNYVKQMDAVLIGKFLIFFTE